MRVSRSFTRRRLSQVLANCMRKELCTVTSSQRISWLMKMDTSRSLILGSPRGRPRSERTETLHVCLKLPSIEGNDGLLSLLINLIFHKIRLVPRNFRHNPWSVSLGLFRVGITQRWLFWNFLASSRLFDLNCSNFSYISVKF